MVALLTGAQRNSAPLRTVIEMLQFGVPRLAGSLELALSSLGANAVLLSAKNLSNLYRNLSGRAEMVQTSPSRELTSRPDPRTAPPDCLGTFLGRLLLSFSPSHSLSLSLSLSLSFSLSHSLSLSFFRSFSLSLSLSLSVCLCLITAAAAVIVITAGGAGSSSNSSSH